MAESETITLGPRQYDKLGLVHCGVTREGHIVVAGDMTELADGAQVTLYDGKIQVSRQGEEYTFTRVQ